MHTPVHSCTPWYTHARAWWQTNECTCGSFWERTYADASAEAHPDEIKIYILISIILFNLSSNFEKVLETNKDSEPEVA